MNRFILTCLLIVLSLQLSAQVGAEYLGSVLSTVKAQNSISQKHYLNMLGVRSTQSVSHYICTSCDKGTADHLIMSFNNDTLYQILYVYKLTMVASNKNFVSIQDEMIKDLTPAKDGHLQTFPDLKNNKGLTYQLEVNRIASSSSDKKRTALYSVSCDFSDKTHSSFGIVKYDLAQISGRIPITGY